MGRCSVNPKQNEGWLPHEFSRIRVRCLLPDVRIAILRTSHDAVRVRSPIDGSDQFVVLRASEMGQEEEMMRTLASERVSVGTHSWPLLENICASLLFKLTASSMDKSSLSVSI